MYWLRCCCAMGQLNTGIFVVPTFTRIEGYTYAAEELCVIIQKAIPVARFYRSVKTIEEHEIRNNVYRALPAETGFCVCSKVYNRSSSFRR